MTTSNATTSATASLLQTSIRSYLSPNFGIGVDYPSPSAFDIITYCKSLANLVPYLECHLIFN
jgi:hypothetical protein